ncbi:MAG TPA: hypothetical protein PLH27_12500 [bacterium]|nr:hypothetical protein [bacterium]HMW33247.1 hypothetical protein [bacterium]HMY37138.1 hypothetical protein [bacterium]HNB55544.1 hypothetical protein [bacterium]HNC49804.1 hypothetical protein [bacterium]
MLRYSYIVFYLIVCSILPRLHTDQCGISVHTVEITVRDLGYSTGEGAQHSYCLAHQFASGHDHVDSLPLVIASIINENKGHSHVWFLESILPRRSARAPPLSV